MADFIPTDGYHRKDIIYGYIFCSVAMSVYLLGHYPIFSFKGTCMLCVGEALRFVYPFFRCWIYNHSAYTMYAQVMQWVGLKVAVLSVQLKAGAWYPFKG